METEEDILCRLCGRLIGTYEPIVALGAEADRETSLAREPGLTRDDPLLHAACYAEWNIPGHWSTSGTHR